MVNKKSLSQIEIFRKSAREAGADMSKEEFARVVGGVAKPKPAASDQKPDTDQAADE